MAWVRYDDNFDTNPKVTAVVFEDPGALSLHVLANTWTNKQKKWKGYVPAHQPATLLCDRELGSRWATALVRWGLWHERSAMCAECAVEYADLPEDAAGYVFHNAKEYRAPARDRATPGTPAELSEKRRAAGRRGGQVSAAKRRQSKQGEANGVSIDSNLSPAGVSPVPVPVPGTTEPPPEVLFDAPPLAPTSATTKKQKAETDRGTRIPEQFGISREMRGWAAEEIPGFDIDREFLRFRDYWRSQTGQKAVRKDWPAVFRNWMRRAYDDRGPSRPGNEVAIQGHRSGPPAGYPDRNGVAVRDTQPRQSAGERKFLRAHEIADELDAELANGGVR
ncbi:MULTISPECIES: hypothetical protein [unclassified Micromonospora]|uniref:hypothetical protein n=1 Tax=unclassified Micromonospora TaxID=2617518 RepID=UPI00331DA78A